MAPVRMSRIQSVLMRLRQPLPMPLLRNATCRIAAGKTLQAIATWEAVKAVTGQGW